MSERNKPQGPKDSAFLDLELSLMSVARAEKASYEAADELVKEYIKERLRERLGEQMKALAYAAADQLADDVEANFEIERLIRARAEQRRKNQDSLASAVRDFHAEKASESDDDGADADG